MSCEVCERLSDSFDKGVKRSCGSLAKSCFELCESLFDWIEVGAISWQVAKGRASLFNGVLNSGDFVTGEIVHEHDITVAQGRGEKVLDIGQETRSVHRPVENTGRGDRIVTQGGNECRRHPMAVRYRCDEALTTRRASIEPRHIGLGPSFINEDKMLQVQIGLACTPFVAGLGDIRPILFGGAE